MGRIVEIPFSENLVEYVVDELIGQEEQDYSSMMVIFPHHRPGLYLRKMLAERLSRPFFPPTIYSMDEFMTFLVEKDHPRRTLITGLDSVWLLYQAVGRIPGNPWQGRAFNQFLFWGLRLTQTIGELDIEMVPNERLGRIKMVEPWEDVSETAGILMAHLAQIREIYHTLLEEQGLTTRERTYAIAAECIEGIDLSPFKAILFAGLFAVTGAERCVLRHLLKGPGVKLIRQNDGRRWTPFEEMDAWAEVEPRTPNSELRTPKIFLHSAFNIHSEVVGLRDELIRSCGYEKTAVVLPQPEPLIPLLSEVMTGLDTDYNITMGYPAVRTPVYGLLDLVIRLQESKRENAYYLPDYLSLLMHPYIKNISVSIESTKMRILIHSVEERLLEAGRMFIELAEIEGMEDIFEAAARIQEAEIPIKDLKDAIANIHNIFIRKMDGVKTLGELSSSFEEMLSHLLRFSQASYYPFSGEFFHSFFSLIEKTRESLIRDEIFKEPKDLFDLFRHLSNLEYIPFTGIPLKGLQILGLLETRALNFERVFLLDANEGVLPAVSAFDPLLPLPLRDALGLPLHYQNEEIYRYHFHHLISGAFEVHIFYREQDAECRSRFVEDLVWEEEKKRGQLKILEPRPVELAISFRPSVGFEVAKTQEAVDLLHRMSLSASSLNSYLSCPAQFYFAKVLGLREREKIDEEFDARNIGEILHKVMEQLYQPFIGKSLLGERDYAAIERDLTPVIEDVFLKEFGEIRGEKYLLKEMILYRLSGYIKKERGIFAGRISLISTEQDLATCISLDDGSSISLKGRVDRIDRIGEEHLIIDYKSGADLKRYYFSPSLKVYRSREEMKEEIENLQLPFYLVLYQRATLCPANRINSRLISLQTGEERSLFNGEIDREEFLERAFLPTIKNLITEILDPKIPFVADNRGRGCNYCPFPVLCRNKA